MKASANAIPSFKPVVVDTGSNLLRRWISIKYPDGKTCVISVGKFGMVIDSEKFRIFQKQSVFSINDTEILAFYLSIVSPIQDDIAPAFVSDPVLRILANEALFRTTMDQYVETLRSWVESYKNYK